MLKKTTFLSILISLIFSACTSMPFGNNSHLKKQDKIISIDGEGISKENFIYLYDKNYVNDSNYYSKENVDNYLELFINFKLKVAEAVSIGYDTLQDFKDEYKMYLHQLEEPYLTESIFNDSLVRQAYERQKIEVNASHILLKVAENASPEDTLKVYTKILEIRNDVYNGKDFNELAILHSEDPSAKQNKGNLGYFTSLQMVYPFEEAAFNTAIDSISNPIRTKFGYHILKVFDKRERFGKLQVQHIMINSTTSFPQEKQVAAQEKAFSIYDSLINGGNWDELCTNFSEDKRSSNNKGILPPVSEVRFPSQFMEGVSSLNKIGDISKPMKTDFGWHIIRLYNKEPVESYETMYPTLVKKVKRDSRSQTSRVDFIKKLKVDNKYQINNENKELAISFVDSTYLNGKWVINEDINIKTLKKTVFSLNTKNVSINDLLSYFAAHQKLTKETDLSKLLNTHFNKYSEIILLEEEKKNLANKYPEYKHLAQEYKDGLLLFRVMEDCVWNKATQDSNALAAYYQSNKENYKWEQRADISIYNTGSKMLSDETLEMLDSNYYQIFPSEVSVINFKKNSSYLYKSKLNDISESAQVLQNDSSIFIVLNVEYSPKENKSLKTKRLNKIRQQYISNGINNERIKYNFEKGLNGVVDIKYYTTNTNNYVKDKNNNNNLSISYQEGIFNKEELPFGQHIEMKEGRYTFEENNRFIIVDVKDILQPSIKILNECKGSVIADYQEYLEKTWVDSLHERHGVVIDSLQLNSLYKTQQSI